MILRDPSAPARRRGVLGIAVLVLVFLGLWALVAVTLTFDEALSAKTSACLQRPPPPEPDGNMFLGVLGLTAPPGVESSALGLEVATGYEQALHARREGRSSARVEFAHQEVGNESALRALCDPVSEGCPQEFVSQASAIDALVSANEGLVENYLALAGFAAFSVTLTPDLEAPVPPTEALVLAQRLVQAKSVLRMHRGEIAAGAAALGEDLLIARRLLAESDHLIYKMTAASMVLRSLHLIAQVSDGHAPLPQAIADLSERLTPISAQELSLASALCGEFRLLSAVFLDPSQVVDMTNADDLPLGVLSNLAYKPNATVNLAFKDLHSTLERLDALSPGEFAERYSSYRDQAEEAGEMDTLDHLLTWPWNPVGSILVRVARPQYSRWYTRLYDLEGLRRIVVLKLLVRKHGLGDAQLAQLVSDRIDGLGDPYADRPLRFDAERRALGFGALSDDRDVGADLTPGRHGRWEIRLPAAGPVTR